MKSLDEYFIRKTEDISFIEIKPDSLVYINNYRIGAEVPLPLIVDELISEIKEGTAKDEVKVSSIINGMIYLIGADPNFKFFEQYKEILYNYDEKVEEYILYIGLKKINENSFEDGLVWLRALYNLNSKNIMGKYNYALALEEKARRLLSNNDNKKIAMFLNSSTNIFEEIINENPNFDLAYYKLGYHYKNSQQYIKGSLMWKKYLQLGKDNEMLDEIRENLEAIQDDIIYEEGYSKILSGNPRAGLEKLLPLKEKYVDWWNLFFMIGLGYRQIGMYKEAIAEFETVLDFVPDQVDALNELGLCLAFLGEGNEAINKFTRAIELRPKDYEIRCNRGMAYLQINDIENAEKDINTAYEMCDTDEITISCKKELQKIKNMA
ncbi:tetratricopeptide repeat protein [Proteiniborus sp.]|uniref:tetratricopeptide repeat protein n=1 Tax=Proteiniborus sp. TaxID=2079015 RepID=UPI00332DB1BA